MRASVASVRPSRESAYSACKSQWTRRRSRATLPTSKVYDFKGLQPPVTSLLLIPLDDTVVFPTMDVTLPVDVGGEDRVVLVPRHEGTFAGVGTIARVADRVRLPGGIRGAQLEGEARGVLGAAHNDGRGNLRIEVA